MSERLRQMVIDARIKLGGRHKLAKKAKCSLGTLVAIERDGHIPKPETIYPLAIACGQSDEDALALAREASEPAKETA